MVLASFAVCIRLLPNRKNLWAGSFYVIGNYSVSLRESGILKWIRLLGSVREEGLDDYESDKYRVS